MSANTAPPPDRQVIDQPPQARSSLGFEVRHSDAPLIDCVWRCDSADGGDLVSVASSHWHLVVSTTDGRTEVSVHGPETVAVRGPMPPGSSWLGIRFGLGVTLAGAPMDRLVDGNLALPAAAHRSFRWKGTAWQLPNYDHAEGLVVRLEREGLLFPDPLVAATVSGTAVDPSLRTVQRRFQAVTGLTRRAYRQIERARLAAVRLREGATPATVAHELGYADQPHLTRSLRRFLGHTPAQLSDPDLSAQLSLLFKTDETGMPSVAFDQLRRRERPVHDQVQFDSDDQWELQAG